MARLADDAHRPLRHRSTDRRHKIERRDLLHRHQRQLRALITRSSRRGTQSSKKEPLEGKSRAALSFSNPSFQTCFRSVASLRTNLFFQSRSVNPTAKPSSDKISKTKET